MAQKAARVICPQTEAQRIVLENLDAKTVQRLSANGLGRGQSFWPRSNARKRVMAAVYALAIEAGWQQFAMPVTATFRWIVPTRGRRDIDNLASNGIVKAALDALKGEDRWLVDDSSQYVIEVRTEMAYEKGRRALEITLEPVR